MKRVVTGVALAFGLALVGPAMAAPGQCTVSGYDTFECDIDVDGGGITFALPDRQVFVFAHEADGAGLAYLIPENVEPGRYPAELGVFRPVEGEAGCWLGEKDGITFCVALVQ